MSRHFSPRTQHRTQQLTKFGIIAFLVILLVVVLGNLDKIQYLLPKADQKPANFYVDTKAILGNLPRAWRNLAQGGEDHAWRIGGITNQVAALKPEYIRIDHIYDFYDIVKGTPGNLTFDFSKLDLVIDDIVKTGAKPYIALSYMPPVIADGDIVSAPKNWGDWQLTIQKTVEHVSGTRKIRDVYYEVWNEPDLFGGWKYYGPKSYLTLYTYAAKGAQNAKGVLPYKLCGPATTANYKNWFDALAKHAIANNLRFDCYTWHRYTTNMNQFPKDITDAHSWIAKYPQLEPTLEIHITEWGHDSNVNAGYDSTYGAAHTVASAISMVGFIERAFVFEIQDGKSPEGKEYWGRWGLFTHNDFGAKAKPRYHALKMLDSLGQQRLQISGQGTNVRGLAALNAAGNPEIVVSNYDAKGRNRENVPITFGSIQPGTYTVSKQYLSGKQSNETIATTAAQIRTMIPLGPNEVAKVSLIRK